jgi:diguanylate cyclase (GGDEF)-like protein
LERTLHRMAFTDQLTGLANRRELLRAVAAARTATDPAGCVLLIDLDGLTGVNDLRGHELGDAVLIEVGRRLRCGVDDSADLSARLGGDQFAVLTRTPPVRAYSLATRLLTMLTEPYRLPGATVHLSAHVGLTALTGTSSVDEVLRRADLALLRAAQSGNGRVEWYDESMEGHLLRQMSLEQELPGVVRRGELDLVYQPIIELAYRQPVGVESLLRWRNPRLGNVPPDELIPVAQRLGLADEIGGWVLHRACRQLSSWLRDGWDLWLSVNVSQHQLVAPGFPAALSEALDTHLVGGHRLLIEVAEESGPDRTDPAEVRLAMAAVRAQGVRVAIDRFGTGLTSLARLRELPVDVLKLDRSLFAEPAGRDGPAAPIIDVVVGLGERLDLEIIAAGLEAEAHLDAVRAAGCAMGQGYLFARPAPAEHLEAYLVNHRSPSF